MTKDNPKPEESRTTRPPERLCGGWTDHGLMTTPWKTSSVVSGQGSAVLLAFVIRHSSFVIYLCALLLVCTLLPSLVHAANADDLFREGLATYRLGDYASAVQAFAGRRSSSRPSGTLQNLGNAEWKLGHTGAAVLAWEQAVWLDPFNDPGADGPALRAQDGPTRGARAGVV